jgi:hypothetical protein
MDSQNYIMEYKSFFKLFLLATLGLSCAIKTQAKPSLTIDDFLTEPDIYDAEFSPDGRYLAIILKDENSRALIIRDFDTEGYPIVGSIKK